MIKLVFSKDILDIKDVQNLKKQLEDFMHNQTFVNFRKRGIVVGISGGIDSAVAAALASNACFIQMNVAPQTAETTSSARRAFFRCSGVAGPADKPSPS